MRRNRGISRAIVAALAATVVTGVVAACGGSSKSSTSQTKMTKVNIGVITTSDYAPVFVAKDQGFFAKYGIDATLMPTATGTTLIPGLARGDLQFASEIALNLIPVQLQGIGPFKIVAAIDSVRVKPSALGILVSPKSGIRSLTQLEGRTVCLPAAGSASQALVEADVLKAGGAPSKIKWAVAPFAGMVQAIQQGKCDAAVVPNPFYSAGIKAGLVDLGDPYFAFGPPGLPNGLLVTTASYAQQNPTVVKNVIAAIKAAVAYSQTHAAVVRSEIMKYTGETAAQVAATTLPPYTATLYLKSLQQYADLAAAVGYVKGRINMNTMVATGAPVVTTK